MVTTKRSSYKTAFLLPIKGSLWITEINKVSADECLQIFMYWNRGNVDISWHSYWNRGNMNIFEHSSTEAVVIWTSADIRLLKPWQYGHLWTFICWSRGNIELELFNRIRSILYSLLYAEHNEDGLANDKPETARIGSVLIDLSLTVRTMVTLLVINDLTIGPGRIT